MPKRVLNALTDKKCKNAKGETLHDGQGLFLVAEGGGKSWLMRYQVKFEGSNRAKGPRRKIGLGPYPLVSLAEARTARDGVLKMCRSGIDPKEARARQQGKMTLGATLDDFLKGYKNSDAGRWEARARKHLAPLMDRMIEDITHTDLAVIFSNLATRVPDTAIKVIPQANQIFKHAFGKGQIEINPVERAKLAVETTLKGRTKQHHPMISPADAPKLYQQLVDADQDITLMALRFVLLCPARARNVRFANWQQIDFESATWTVSAADTKTGKQSGQDFVTPMAPQALALLQEVRDLVGLDQGLIFPGSRRGQELSDATIAKRLKSFGYTDPRDGRLTVPHGLRATFKTWSRDYTEFDEALVERALDHKVKGDVQKAYDRADMVERRRDLMCTWANFLTGIADENVIDFNRRRRAS